MKIEFHSLYWPNTNQGIVDSHKAVMSHFKIPVNYTAKQIDHGQWMNSVLEKAKSDVIVFFDVDCVPINMKYVESVIRWVNRSKGYAGITQVSNHIPPATHIYAAPAFFVIHKQAWDEAKVSMVAGSDGKRAGDVCEIFNYVAEDLGIRRWLLFPNYYYKAPVEGIWRLADEGCYGIGTVFQNTVYHLYQSRFSENIELFKNHCDSIINGGLNYSEFIEVKDERL